MPENEFEKQVQKVLEELKVSPSEKVWPAVKERIRNKKRRRRLIIFPLLSGLVLLGYIAVPYLFSKNKSGISKENNQVENGQPVKLNTTARRGSAMRDSQTKKIPGKELSSPSATTVPGKAGSIIYNRNLPDKKLPANRIALTDEMHEMAPLKRIKEQPQKTDLATGLSFKSNDNKTDIPTAGINNKNLNEDIAASMNKPASVYSDSPKTKSPEISEIIARKPATTPKIIWGFQFSTGVSGINEKLFSLSKDQSAADLYSVSSGAAAYPSGNAPPSKSKAGFAFQVGPLARKKISKLGYLSIGFYYGYNSNHIKVGARRSSVLQLSGLYSAGQTISNYYQGNAQNDFTNKYHFIALPVQYSLQLNKGRNIPITWDVGISPARMIASNGLVYDTSNGGIYYKDKGLLNKYNAGISMGFSAGFPLAKQMRLTAGPDIRFSLSRLYKNDLDQNKYLWYGGIKMILFPSYK